MRQDSQVLCIYSHVFKQEALDAKLSFAPNIVNICNRILNTIP